MVGVAIVGLGEIARHAHLPALLRNDDVIVVAAADASARQRGEAEQVLPLGIPILESLDDVLRVDGVDVVVLATPPWVTPQLAIRAAQSGRFVLVEKPVATSVEASEAYAVLSESERRRVQVGLSYRHDPAIQELRAILDVGELGAPLLVRAHIYDERRTADVQHTALIERTLEHGSPVVHEGAHVFDWLSFLLGDNPIIQDAWAVQTRPGLAAPNLVGARVSYPAGDALVEFGWLVDELPRCELSVLGDQGYAVLDGATFALTVYTAEGVREITYPGDRVARCFDLQVQRLVELATGVRLDAEPGLDDGITALVISEKVARRAMETARGIN